MYGSANPRVDFQRIVALADEGRLDLGALVGKTRPFLEVNEVIAETRTSDVTRVVLTF